MDLWTLLAVPTETLTVIIKRQQENNPNSFRNMYTICMASGKLSQCCQWGFLLNVTAQQN